MQEHVSRLADVGFWRPYVAEILERHGLADSGREPVAGFNATYPTLPAHLVAQIDDYLARLGPLDRVFVHGDLVANHAYVVNGRLAGIIDWGDSMATDRHYELGKLYFDTFRCDKALLRVFLDASDWPAGEDFPRKTLGLALHRQAVGLTQHHSFDVFHTLPTVLPLQDIGTLDELATELFAV